MTISAKQTALLLLIALACPSGLTAAEFRFAPSIGISEDVTDNIEETHSDRKTELVTEVQPGGALFYATRLSKLEAIYSFDYRYYVRNSRKDEISHNLALVGSFALVEEFLRLDISDTYSRVSLDVARDNRSETHYFNQTDQNTFRVSPYLLWRLGRKSTLKTGGRYSDIRYRSSAGIDRREKGVFAQLSHEVGPRLGLTAGYVFDKTAAGPLRYDDHSVSAGLRYLYAESSFVFGTLGNSRQSFNNGKRSSNLFWDAGISKTFGTVVATLETQVRYSEDPLTVSLQQTSYRAKLDKVMPRGAVTLSAAYDKYVATEDGTPDRHGVTVSSGGSREIRPDVTASINVTGDRLSRRASLDYPYHVTATGTLGYALKKDARLGLIYTYATYRYGLLDAEDSVEVNRVVAQFTKVF